MIFAAFLLFGPLVSANTDLETSCRNCPLINPHRTPEMIEAEERLRKDLFHNKLLEAFRNFKPFMDAMRQGGPNLDIPSPVIANLQSYRNKHFNEEVIKPLDLRDQKMYILGDEIKPRRRRASNSQQTMLCNDDSGSVCVEMEIPPHFEYASARDTRLWVYPVPFPEATATVEIANDESANNPLTVDIADVDASESSGWLHFDVARFMMRWKRNQKNSTNTKVIRMKSTNGCPLRIASSGSKRPYLEVKIEPSLSRQKRGEARQSCPDGSYSFCCRRPLFYNFTEYNWTFIHEPKDGIDIGYCGGNCKLIQTARQALVSNQAAKRNAVVYPCCFPSRFSDQGILYRVNETIYAGSLANFVVESCECGI